MTPTNLSRYHHALVRDGYVLLPEADTGLGPSFRAHVLTRYFAELAPDLPTVHSDRDRSRCVLRYTRSGAAVELEELEQVAIVNRNHAGTRVYPRVSLRGDPLLHGFVRTSLSLIPEERRTARSTFSINLFRTRTRVTMGPHQDLEPFVVVHLLRKVGAGAHTELYDAADPARLVESLCLREGDTLLIDDRRFLHHVTPLEPVDGRSVRDALVCTLDHPETYSGAP
jgi:2OG-Fe dioxygenase